MVTLNSKQLFLVLSSILLLGGFVYINDERVNCPFDGDTLFVDGITLYCKGGLWVYEPKATVSDANKTLIITPFYTKNAASLNEINVHNHKFTLTPKDGVKKKCYKFSDIKYKYDTKLISNFQVVLLSENISTIDKVEYTDYIRLEAKEFCLNETIILSVTYKADPNTNPEWIMVLGDMEFDYWGAR